MLAPRAAFRGPVYYMQQPHLLTYNLTVEQQLPGSMALTVAYAGSRGIDLLQDKEGNPEIPNGIPSGGICVCTPGGDSHQFGKSNRWTGNFLLPGRCPAKEPQLGESDYDHGWRGLLSITRWRSC